MATRIQKILGAVLLSSMAISPALSKDIDIKGFTTDLSKKELKKVKKDNDVGFFGMSMTLAGIKVDEPWYYWSKDDGKKKTNGIEWNIYYSNPGGILGGSDTAWVLNAPSSWEFIVTGLQKKYPNMECDSNSTVKNLAGAEFQNKICILQKGDDTLYAEKYYKMSTGKITIMKTHMWEKRLKKNKKDQVEDL